MFDFGAQVDGYRSDMTRTIFVGEPAPAEQAIYRIVAEAQAAALAAESKRRLGPNRRCPSGLAIDGLARSVIERAGYGPKFGHGTGHGIGLATHELPSLGRLATADPLPSPTVFSVEPGSISTARLASASRTSSRSTTPPAGATC